MRKLDNVDRKLMENVKWQKETDSKLEKLFWNILGINWKADSSVNSFVSIGHLYINEHGKEQFRD